jgi:hypothetical protein
MALMGANAGAPNVRGSADGERCDCCGKPGQGPFDRFHVGGRVWVGWDCMTVEEQRRERMVCKPCQFQLGSSHVQQRYPLPLLGWI